jgi:hypothetical protein
MGTAARQRHALTRRLRPSSSLVGACLTGTRLEVPLIFRAAAALFALLQFALMAGARWNGAPPLGCNAAAMRTSSC